MALTPSNMLPLGTAAPAFDLPECEGGQVAYRDLGDGPKVVMFICNHCPFVKHIRSELVAVYDTYTPRGVHFVAINSNDTEAYPADNQDAMVTEKQTYGYKFPYLLDETQAIAKAYQAACTPDFYLFDAQDKLVYRGRLDASSPGNGAPLDGRDLRRAIDAVLAGEAPGEEQLPSMGCNIKWRPGNA